MTLELSKTRLAELEEQGVEWPLPTEDDLPYDDGMPMETGRHYNQMHLLIDPLRLWLQDRPAFVGGNMFLYFSLEQARNQDFRGPDVFVALDVPRRERKSWLVWKEGKAPDVIIELLSASTALRDKHEKKEIYQNKLRVPEYFWFDPFSGEIAGFILREGVYQPIQPDAQGRLRSQVLNLFLVHWQGIYQDIEIEWLRWTTPDGIVLPTSAEVAEQERLKAEQERLKAEQEHQRAERLAAKLKELGLNPDDI